MQMMPYMNPKLFYSIASILALPARSTCCTTPPLPTVPKRIPIDSMILKASSGGGVARLTSKRKAGEPSSTGYQALDGCLGAQCIIGGGYIVLHPIKRYIRYHTQGDHKTIKRVFARCMEINTGQKGGYFH